MEENGKTLEDRTDMLNQMLAMCGTTNKADAQKMKTELIAQKAMITDTQIQKIVQSEIDDMSAIIALTGNTTREKL